MDGRSGTGCDTVDFVGEGQVGMWIPNFEKSILLLFDLAFSYDESSFKGDGVRGRISSTVNGGTGCDGRRDDQGG